MAPSVVGPYVVARTYGLAVIRSWYVAMTEVTAVSVIVPEIFVSNATGIRLTTPRIRFMRNSITGAKIKDLRKGMVGLGEGSHIMA